MKRSVTLQLQQLSNIRNLKLLIPQSIPVGSIKYSGKHFVFTGLFHGNIGDSIIIRKGRFNLIFRQAV